MPGGVVAVAPARLFDSRAGEFTVDGVGLGSGVLPAKSTTRVQVTGRAGVPVSGVAGAVLNVTAVRSEGGGFLTVFPCDEGLPLASNVNTWTSGQTVAGSVVSKLGATGEVCVYTSQRVDLVVDVSGWVRVKL